MHKRSEKSLAMWLQGENWVKVAAQKGHIPAMVYLGHIMETYYNDTDAAEHWYSRAANEGDAQGIFKLGTL